MNMQFLILIGGVLHFGILLASAAVPQVLDWPKELAKLDPTKIWQEALSKGVDNPGLIIACTDFLMQYGYGRHTVEFLKANLRLGIVVRPWVYESLALALEASNASPAEIERARVSVVDLQPQDAQGYVRASQAMADMKLYKNAVAYCRQASLLEPNLARPYEEALMYGELAKDSSAMEWAASNLLRRDWPVLWRRTAQSSRWSSPRSVSTACSRFPSIDEPRSWAFAWRSARLRDVCTEWSWNGARD